jgi:hypothetical protein
MQQEVLRDILNNKRADGIDADIFQSFEPV